MPGAVDKLVETTVRVVRLPEIVIVEKKLCVTVVTLPGNVLMMVLPGRDVVTVRVKLAVSLFNVNVSDVPG